MSELRLRRRGPYWQYSFEGARIDGKRQAISKSGFRTKRKLLPQVHKLCLSTIVQVQSLSLVKSTFLTIWTSG